MFFQRKDSGQFEQFGVFVCSGKHIPDLKLEELTLSLWGWSVIVSLAQNRLISLLMQLIVKDLFSYLSTNDENFILSKYRAISSSSFTFLENL